MDANDYATLKIIIPKKHYWLSFYSVLQIKNYPKPQRLILLYRHAKFVDDAFSHEPISS